MPAKDPIRTPEEKAAYHARRADPTQRTKFKPSMKKAGVPRGDGALNSPSTSQMATDVHTDPIKVAPPNVSETESWAFTQVPLGLTSPFSISRNGIFDPESWEFELEGHEQELSKIGTEDEMAPVNIPEDPNTLRFKAESETFLKLKVLEKEEKAIVSERVAREQSSGAITVEEGQQEKWEKIFTEEGKSGVVPDPTLKGLMAAEKESRAFRYKTSEAEKKKKDLEDATVNVARFFDPECIPPDGARHIFQFPRTFPNMVREEDAAHLRRPQYSSEGIKLKPVVDERKEKFPPPRWGTSGPLQNLASRFPIVDGNMGELCIRKSGKVTMKIHGDLEFDVISAADPTFLQELAILNHDPALIPLQPGQTEADRPPSNPDGKLKILGQVFKKFIVVPEANNLLEKIAEQEKNEAELSTYNRLLRMKIEKEKKDKEMEIEEAEREIEELEERGRKGSEKKTKGKMKQ